MRSAASQLLDREEGQVGEEDLYWAYSYAGGIGGHEKLVCRGLPGHEHNGCTAMHDHHRNAPHTEHIILPRADQVIR